MLWRKRTYLDRAAGAAGNPSSPHEEGRRAKAMLENARTDIARLLEVQSDDVIFTSGATESNALAILGHVRARRAAASGKAHVLYLPTAHASIVENMQLLAAEGVLIEALPIRAGRVDTDRLSDMLRHETVLVSMDAVCGETGIVWNTREVAEVLQNASGGSATGRILLHVDASQAPLTEKITRTHFGADLLTLDASKVGVTRGIGALVAHRTIALVPLYGGGGQERALRPGTEAPELAQSFSTALRAAVSGRAVFRAAAKRDRAHLIRAITNTIQNVYIQEGRVQAPHILNLSFPGRDTDYLVALLDEAGFAVSTRSACETDSQNGSRVVFALTGDRERARATLRISWDSRIRSRSLARFASALARGIAFIDTMDCR